MMNLVYFEMFENMNFNVKALLFLLKLNKFAVRSVPKFIRLRVDTFTMKI